MAEDPLVHAAMKSQQSMTAVINIGKITSEFIWHVEEVMDLYEQPYDPGRPIVCFDERPCQLIGDSIVPLPIEPERTKKEHYEYIRASTCCIFIAFKPSAGKRLTYVSEHRTKVDYANFTKMIAEIGESALFVCSLRILILHKNL